MPDLDDAVTPHVLAEQWQAVASSVRGAVATEDRRGFRLLHWGDTTGGGKPTELSLEHEGRLRPADDASTGRLLVALLSSSGGRAGDDLLSSDDPLAHYGVRQYERPPGPQSIDHYHDVTGDASLPLTRLLVTVRERRRVSDFMTWRAKPLNAELPFVALTDTGVTARLEFNWQGDLAAGSAVPDNPLSLLAGILGRPLDTLSPVLEHAVARLKFGLHDDFGERFVINVDVVTCRGLEPTAASARYVDVDVSSVRIVDTAELRGLTALVRALSVRYDLVASHNTKASRDASILGLLPDWEPRPARWTQGFSGAAEL